MYSRSTDVSLMVLSMTRISSKSCVQFCAAVGSVKSRAAAKSGMKRKADIVLIKLASGSGSTRCLVDRKPWAENGDGVENLGGNVLEKLELARPRRARFRPAERNPSLRLVRVIQ